MAHIFKEKKNIAARINRIKGQLSSIESLLEKEEDCFKVLQTLSACRGALNGLIGHIMDGHIRYHIMSNPETTQTEQDTAALELIRLLKTYWK